MTSRYDGEVRPASWDSRAGGVDVVKTVDGDTLRLCSEAGQNTPQPGWVILLTAGDAESGYAWTLYGMPVAADASGAH